MTCPSRTKWAKEERDTLPRSRKVKKEQCHDRSQKTNPSDKRGGKPSGGNNPNRLIPKDV